MLNGETNGVAGLRSRLVAEGFAVRNGILEIGGLLVTDLARTFGTPIFVYDAEKLRQNYRVLSEAVAGFAQVYYSIKANPLPAVASVFVAEGAGLEVASIGEFRRALDARCEPRHILFAGPGKGKHELEETIESGIGEIHLESLEEAEHVERIGRKLGRRVNCAIRVNPEASAQGGAMRMGGKPTAFGFDEECLQEVLARLLEFDHIAVTGVHLFSGTQVLNSDVLVAQWRHGLDVASRVARATGQPLLTIDLGGGLGVPYHDGEEPLDLTAIRKSVPELVAIKNAVGALRDANVILEPGRFLTASAGIYLVSVRAVKHSREQRFIVTDGGMHHHLAASGNLGQVIKRDYPIVAADRMHVAAQLHQANVVGPLCTPLDTIGRQTDLPVLKAGNLIAVLQSGAYGITASPLNFLSHPPPAEVLIDEGRAKLVRAASAVIG